MILSQVFIIFVLLSCQCHVEAFANFKQKVVKIHASKTVVQPVSPSCEHDNEETCLHQYMQLPASQYTCVPMPLDASLTRLHGSTNQFCLEVPKMKFGIPGLPQKVEVLPSVKAKVNVQPTEVLIESDCCTIRGSPLIEKLNLNDRFDFQCVARLTWGQADSNVHSKDELMSLDTIRAHTEIDVDFYPNGKFARVPPRVLRLVGNLAMYLALNALLTNFMQGLGGDYERWATDSAYRVERQNMELEIESELQQQQQQQQNVERQNMALEIESELQQQQQHQNTTDGRWALFNWR